MEMVSTERPDSSTKTSPADADSPLVPRKTPADTLKQEIKNETHTCACSACDYRLYHSEEIEEQGVTPSIACGAFSDRASLVGLTQINESTGIAKKTFWAAITVISLGFLITHTYLLITRFASFDTNIELHLVTQKRLDFPAVTICNNNMMKVPPANVTTFIGGGIRNLDNYVDYLHLNDSSLGHQKEDLIVWGSFDNRNLSTDDFELVINGIYGNCYTFNMKGLQRTRRALPGYGLQMILNAETYSYNNFPNGYPPSWKGVVVKVHSHNTEAIVEEGGVPVATNSLARLALKKTVLTRLNGMYGKCLGEKDTQPSTYYKGTYTKGHCDNTCLQREVISQCCCYIKTINRDLTEFPTSWNSCNKLMVQPCVEQPDNSRSQTCWERVWDEYDNGRLACNSCVDRCREEVYDSSIATVEWPSREYLNGVLKDELQSRGRLLDQLLLYNVTQNRTETEEVINENFLMVQIYYESMTTTYIDQVAAVGIAEFFSEMSSAVGFWVSWSVWTVFQFCELLSDLIVIAFRSRQKQKYKEESSATDRRN